MTLREVCESLGISRRAIQGYEKIGVVSASRKNERGYLIYDLSAQKRIEQVKLYQQLGFAIKEIKEIIDAPNGILKCALINRVFILESEQKNRQELINVANLLIQKL